MIDKESLDTHRFDRRELVNFLNARGRRLRKSIFAAQFRLRLAPLPIINLNASLERRVRNDEDDRGRNNESAIDNIDGTTNSIPSFKYLASRSLTRLNEIAIASAIIRITWRTMRQPRNAADAAGSM